uniref:Si:ch211-195d17.2 n=1 Tax=Echeneis naucrates TaxID=173247 RepID=A0A665VTN3_ECHNA
MVKCVVSGCPNRMVGANRGILNRPLKRFFNFPEDPTRVKVWLAALRETDKQDLTEQHLICEDHFLPEDISSNGVNSDAIPIMPPCLEGSSFYETQLNHILFLVCDAAGREDDLTSDCESHYLCFFLISRFHIELFLLRSDVSLGWLTRGFLELLLASPDGSLDLRQVAVSLNTRKRRIYDITNVLNSIQLIQKESTNRIKWIGKSPISHFLWKNQQRLQKELDNLKLVEDTLDGLIKSCAQQLFDMTDDVENSAYPLTPAYVTHEDISRLRDLQEQTVIVVKAPEETKLEIPAPSEDSIQVNLKAGKGPIMVVTCEVGSEGAVTSDPGESRRVFCYLKEKNILTFLVDSADAHTETTISC